MKKYENPIRDPDALSAVSAHSLYSLLVIADQCHDEAIAGREALLRACAATLEAEIERLHTALLWYRDEAVAIAVNLKRQQIEAVHASMTVLALDAGKRADEALGKVHDETKAA